MGITIIVKNKERLPYGDKHRGRFVAAEKGRRNIFVPSWGALEEEEVDYLVEVAQEQEDERLKKGEERTAPVKETLGNLVDLAMKTEPGHRSKAIKEALGRK